MLRFRLNVFFRIAVIAILAAFLIGTMSCFVACRYSDSFEVYATNDIYAEGEICYAEDDVNQIIYIVIEASDMFSINDISIKDYKIEGVEKNDSDVSIATSSEGSFLDMIRQRWIFRIAVLITADTNRKDCNINQIDFLVKGVAVTYKTNIRFLYASNINLKNGSFLFTPSLKAVRQDDGGWQIKDGGLYNSPFTLKKVFTLSNNLNLSENVNIQFVNLLSNEKLEDSIFAADDIGYFIEERFNHHVRYEIMGEIDKSFNIYIDTIIIEIEDENQIFHNIQTVYFYN